jgi:hypothetical protein
MDWGAIVGLIRETRVETRTRSAAKLLIASLRGRRVNQSCDRTSNQTTIANFSPNCPNAFTSDLSADRIH